MKKYFVSNSTPETLLNENGRPYACPFAPPMIVQNRLTGEFQTVSTPCSSDCLFYDSKWNIEDDTFKSDKDKTVILDCCNTVIQANIYKP